MSDWGSIADWLGAGSQLLAAIVTIVIVVQTQKTIKISSKSEGLKVFNEFAERYDKLRADYLYVVEPDSYEQYAPGDYNPDLIADACVNKWKFFEREFFIFQNELIEKNIWEIWLKGMKKNTKSRNMQIYWNYYKDKHASEKFIEFAKLELLDKELNNA